MFRVREQGSRGRAGCEAGADPTAVGESDGGRHHGAGAGGEESTGGARETSWCTQSSGGRSSSRSEPPTRSGSSRSLHRYTAKTKCVSQVHIQN